MVGTIIGAGIFGLPAAFAAVGFWQGSALFGLLALTSTLTHVLFAGLLLSEHKRMRLTGLVQRRLDPFFHVVAQITYPLQIFASLFAYIILGGEFISLLARAAGLSLPLGLWQLFFWIGGSATIIFGLKAVAQVNSLATTAKMLAILLAVAVAWPFVDGLYIRFDGWAHWYLPFGIFLYSLSGMSAVGETIDLVKRQKRTAIYAVALGSLLSASLSWLFGVGIFLAARGYPLRTVTDIISVLPSTWALLIPFLGLLSVMTAYLTMAEDVKETFDLDYKLNAKQATFIALSIPLMMLMFFSRDFLGVIGFIGSVFVSINGLMVCAMAFKAFEKVRRASSRLIRLFTVVMLSAIYLFGLIQRILFRESL